MSTYKPCTARSSTYLSYLREQLQYLNKQHCSAAIHAQYWADRCFTAGTANAAETAAAAICPVPANANEPSMEEHTRSQPASAAPIARSNSTTYAQAVMSTDTPLSPTVKRSTRTKANGSLGLSRQRCKSLGSRWPRTSNDSQPH